MMPAPCPCLSPLTDWPVCCGEQTGLLLLSAWPEGFPENQRGCDADSECMKVVRVSLHQEPTGTRHLGGNEMGSAPERLF